MNDLSGISAQSRKLLSLLLRETKQSITVQEASKIMGLGQKQTAKLLSKWAKSGWVYRIHRGVYIPVPLESSTPEPVIEDAWVIAQSLFEPCYIGGWSAAEHWDLTEQMFRATVVLTTKRFRKKGFAVGEASFYLKNILPKGFFGLKKIWRGNRQVQVSDPTRTIIDLMDDPILGGGIRPSSDILRSYLRSKNKSLDLLAEYSLQHGNRTIFKRLGFLVERFEPEALEFIEYCHNKSSKGYSKLDPSLPAKKIDTKWKLWVPDSWHKGLCIDTES